LGERTQVIADCCTIVAMVILPKPIPAVHCAIVNLQSSILIQKLPG
jgi:hypothetical protein